MKRRLLFISILLVLVFLIVIVVFTRYVKNSNKFIMYIEEAYVTDDGVYLTGIVNKGKVKKDDKLEIVNENILSVKVKNILVDDKEVKSYGSKGRISINVGDIDANSIKRGLTLATRGTIEFTRNVKMEITLNSDTERQIKNGTGLVFKIGPENYGGNVIMEDSLVATQTGVVTVVLDDKAPVYKDVDVTVKYDGQEVIGKGKIVEIK